MRSQHRELACAETERESPGAPSPTEQRWAYLWALSLIGIALGIAVLPTPLWAVYANTFHLSPLTVVMVFAVYAVSALVAVLTSGRISDVVGRKPLLIMAMVGLIAGLMIFIFAESVALLMSARIIHGAAVGTVIVVGAAALLDLRPAHGTRSGLLSGVVFNIGNTVAVVGCAVLVQYAPHPLRTPYAVALILCLIAAPGLVFLREPLQQRARGRRLIVAPSVPHDIRVPFWFAGLGVMTSWSVMAVQMSMYPNLVAQQTGTTNIAVIGSVIGTTVLVSAVVQLLAARMPAARTAIIGVLGMAAAILLANPILQTRQWVSIFVLAAMVGATFGLASGGSLRYLAAIVPAERRGETMSAYYVLAYLSMGVPVALAGWAATKWPLPTVFSWFAGFVAAACVAASAIGVLVTRPARK